MTGTTRRACSAWPRAGRARMLLLAGCGFRGAYSFSLPGGADSATTRTPCRWSSSTSSTWCRSPASRSPTCRWAGSTRSSWHDDWTARVTLTVNGDVDLPANAVAKIQQSSLLGEKFVELAAPGNEKPAGQLRDDPRIPLERTNRNVEVEELLGALSLVLNGGGLAQLQTINQELGEALEGRESAVRSTLTELDTFIGGLDAAEGGDQPGAGQRQRARRHARRAHRDDRHRAGHDRPRAWTSSTSSATCSCRCSQSLARLGDVGTRIINQSAADTVADLQLLQPILTQLAAAGPDLAGSLDLLLTYPFPASSVIGAGNGGHAAELPAGPAHRRVRAVHEHDRDARARPDPDPVPVRRSTRSTGALEELRPGRTSPAARAGRPARRRATSGGTPAAGRRQRRPEPARRLPVTSSASSPAPPTGDRRLPACRSSRGRRR